MESSAYLQWVPSWAVYLQAISGRRTIWVSCRLLLVSFLIMVVKRRYRRQAQVEAPL